MRSSSSSRRPRIRSPRMSPRTSPSPSRPRSSHRPVNRPTRLRVGDRRRDGHRVTLLPWPSGIELVLDTLGLDRLHRWLGRLTVDALGLDDVGRPPVRSRTRWERLQRDVEGRFVGLTHVQPSGKSTGGGGAPCDVSDVQPAAPTDPSHANPSITVAVTVTTTSALPLPRFAGAIAVDDPRRRRQRHRRRRHHPIGTRRLDHTRLHRHHRRTRHRLERHRQTSPSCRRRSVHPDGNVAGHPTPPHRTSPSPSPTAPGCKARPDQRV